MSRLSPRPLATIINSQTGMRKQKVFRNSYIRKKHR